MLFVGFVVTGVDLALGSGSGPGLLLFSRLILFPIQFHGASSQVPDCRFLSSLALFRCPVQRVPSWTMTDSRRTRDVHDSQAWRRGRDLDQCIDEATMCSTFCWFDLWLFWLQHASRSEDQCEIGFFQKVGCQVQTRFKGDEMPPVRLRKRSCLGTYLLMIIGWIFYPIRGQDSNHYPTLGATTCKSQIWPK